MIRAVARAFLVSFVALGLLAGSAVAAAPAHGSKTVASSATKQKKQHHKAKMKKARKRAARTHRKHTK